MKAENLRNYIDKEVKVSFWNTWEELVNNGNSSEWVETAGIQTIKGKVILLDNQEHILQDSGELNCFLNKETKITIEVVN